MRLRTVFIIIISFLVLWFLYLEGAILTPFVLAAIIAYVLSPAISFLSSKTKLHKVVVIAFFYLLLFLAIGWLVTHVTTQLFSEAQELSKETQTLLQNAQTQIGSLPGWMQVSALNVISSIRDALTLGPESILPFFSGAASRVIATITFLFALFYFLKDGSRFIEDFLLWFPGEHKLETEIILRKINNVLGNYLRGQLLIVVIVAVLGFAILTFYGVKFSLMLGLMIGLAEIIPMIGPIIAGTTIGLVAAFDGVSRFGLAPLSDALFVVSTYIVVNQVENYLIVPHIMGKITKLHPLLILFAVLAGGHLFGILGFILAVPAAASLRIFFEYLLDKLAAK